MFTIDGGLPADAYFFLSEEDNLKLVERLRKEPQTREIIAALEGACASPALSRQDDSLTNQLFRYTVIMKMLHREEACRERVIAREIWCIHDHNPAADPRIRMAKLALTRKLEAYYKKHGHGRLIEFRYDYGFVPDIRHCGAALLIDPFVCLTPRIHSHNGSIFQTALAGRIESVRGLSIHLTCPPKPCPKLFEVSGSFASEADAIHVTVCVTRIDTGEPVFVKYGACQAEDIVRMAAAFTNELIGHLQKHVVCVLGPATMLAGDAGKFCQPEDEDPNLPAAYTG